MNGGRVGIDDVDGLVRCAGIVTFVSGGPRQDVEPVAVVLVVGHVGDVGCDVCAVVGGGSRTVVLPVAV